MVGGAMVWLMRTMMDVIGVEKGWFGGGGEKGCMMGVARSECVPLLCRWWLVLGGGCWK